MERAYKFRLYPDAEQEELIQKTFGCVRFVYNHYLDKRIGLYKTEAKTLGYNACSADLTELKKQIAWLKEVDATALQASLRIWTLRTRTSSVAKNKLDVTQDFQTLRASITTIKPIKQR